jgi:hypothetical protein
MLPHNLGVTSEVSREVFRVSLLDFLKHGRDHCGRLIN